MINTKHKLEKCEPLWDGMDGNMLTFLLLLKKKENILECIKMKAVLKIPNFNFIFFSFMIPKAFCQKWMPVLGEQSKIKRLYYFDLVSFPWKKYSLKVNAKTSLALTCHFPVLKMKYTISDHTI